MANYRYKAKDLSGKTVRGATEAGSEAEFYQYLEEQQLYCISVSVTGQDKNVLKTGNRRLKPKVLSVFCRELAVLLMSGMNLLAALRLLYEREEKIQ